MSKVVKVMLASKGTKSAAEKEWLRFSNLMKDGRTKYKNVKLEEWKSPRGTRGSTVWRVIADRPSTRSWGSGGGSRSAGQIAGGPTQKLKRKTEKYQ
jgi:hypothetical protein